MSSRFASGLIRQRKCVPRHLEDANKQLLENACSLIVATGKNLHLLRSVFARVFTLRYETLNRWMTAMDLDPQNWRRTEHDRSCPEAD